MPVTRTERRMARFFGAIDKIFRLCDHSSEKRDHSFASQDAAAQQNPPAPP
jgi:hypothetical protein